ncbi:protein-disulfide reductase DsbD family protein [Thalassospira lucentensis]|uniref:protein-disulfide reductase DsbD family protein n=1 Tax=Thalassospira lucentensis TaxID=168935 RepID=UPI00142E2177|nr:copper-binding protein [Thalassospira lucentensis]
MLRHLITRFVFLLAALCAPVLTLPAVAATDVATPWTDEDFTSVRLISAQTQTGPSHTLRLGLEFELQPDWKIYWRSAGDAGFPPNLDWTGSQNVGDAHILWPAPHRFSIFGLETFGYKNHIILPIDVAIPDRTHPVAVNLAVDYLVCSDICIPASATFALDIPAGGDASKTASNASITSKHAHEIEKFVSQVPLSGDNLPINVTSIFPTQSGEATQLRLSVSGLSNAGVSVDDIMVESPLRIGFGAPVMTDENDDADIRTFDIPVLGLKPDETLASEKVTVTVVAGPLAIEQDLTVGKQDASGSSSQTSTPSNAASSAKGASSANSAGTNIWLIGLFALLGGLILNVMPCVLPVLSIKVMSAINARDSEISRVRSGFLASAAGIVTSFWLIAAVLIGIKFAGGSIGWGIQFQQPLFLTVMTIVLALFALNMWGLFEINGSDNLGTAANDVITQQEKGGRHLSSHFMTGMFATLLATPCSAPFLGTAVGFALAGSSFDILWIFTLLGIGLATPYLAIAIQPRLAHLLPKPGRWMNVVKVVLGVALVGTAVWLLGILSVQIGLGGAIAVGIGLVFGSVFVWARTRSQTLRTRFIFTALAVCGFLVALFAPGFSRPPAASNTANGPNGTNEALNWQAFAPESIPALIADGKTVFVDITAEWCVSCQVNKKLVLETDDVANTLAEDDIVLMQADWTRPDQQIADYLASYGRYGIPFNAVFGPSTPDGVLLSELLSKDAVLDAIKDAR